MKGQIWFWLSAYNLGTETVEFNGLSGNYIIAQPSLIEYEHGMSGFVKLGIVGFTPDNGPAVDFGGPGTWQIYINGSGISSVTFGAFAGTLEGCLGMANVFLW
jgi:hypothetical protein